MEIKDIFLAYEVKSDARKAVEEKASQLRREAARLDERASKKRELAQKILNEADPAPNWIDDIAAPLAEELARRKGLQAEILGPMGLACRTLVLVSDPDVIPSKQEHYRLTIRPSYKNGKFCLAYETGEETDRYEARTVGAMSGLNFVTAPLPDSVDEIEKLLKKVPALS